MAQILCQSVLCLRIILASKSRAEHYWTRLRLRKGLLHRGSEHRLNCFLVIGVHGFDKLLCHCRKPLVVSLGAGRHREQQQRDYKTKATCHDVLRKVVRNLSMRLMILISLSACNHPVFPTNSLLASCILATHCC